jgi:hypothetical protein
LIQSGAIKTCPTCRTQSHFILPSFHFVTGVAKDKMIETYKTKLASISCKYFESSKKMSNKERTKKYRFRSPLGYACPFGNACFYAHVDEKGKRVELEEHARCTRRNTRQQSMAQIDLNFLASMLDRVNLLSSGVLEVEHEGFLEFDDDNFEEEYDPDDDDSTTSSYVYFY